MSEAFQSTKGSPCRDSGWAPEWESSWFSEGTSQRNSSLPVPWWLEWRAHTVHRQAVIALRKRAWTRSYDCRFGKNDWDHSKNRAAVWGAACWVPNNWEPHFPRVVSAICTYEQVRQRQVANRAQDIPGAICCIWDSHRVRAIIDVLYPVFWAGSAYTQRSHHWTAKKNRCWKKHSLSQRRR